MKASLSIHPDFLSKALLLDVKNEISAHKEKHCWMSSRFKCDWRILDDLGGTYYISKPSDEIKLRIVEELKEMPEFKDYDINLNTIRDTYYFLGDCYASIGWHTDAVQKAGISVYLVDWDNEWGGIFQYKDPDDNEEIKQILPQQNLAVMTHGELWHSVTAIGADVPLRESLQIFVGSDK